MAAEDRADRRAGRRRFGRFLDFVAPVDHPVVKQFAEQWQARGSDPEFQEVRRAAQRIDAQDRTSTS